MKPSAGDAHIDWDSFDGEDQCNRFIAMLVERASKDGRVRGEVRGLNLDKSATV